MQKLLMAALALELMAGTAGAQSHMVYPTIPGTGARDFNKPGYMIKPGYIDRGSSGTVPRPPATATPQATSPGTGIPGSAAEHGSLGVSHGMVGLPAPR